MSSFTESDGVLYDKPSLGVVVDPALLGSPSYGIVDSHDDTEMYPADQHDASTPPNPKDEEMDDLFGDENEEGDKPYAVEQSRSGSPTGSDSGLASAEIARRKALEYEEEDEPRGEFVQLREAAVSIPNLPVPTSSDNSYWSLRTPNFIKIDSRPFLPETYVGPDEDSHQDEDNRHRSMGIKLEVQNTMRWRWVKGPDGEMHKQSNSRIIRWSDGSMSLQLGKEMFEVQANVDPYVTRLRQGSMASPVSSQTTASSQGLSAPLPKGGPTYLVAQHKRAQILQTEKLLTGSLTLLPTSMGGTHQMLVRAVGQKHSKVSRLRMAPDPVRDYEKEAQEAAKKATKQRRQSAKKEEGVTPKKRRSYAKERNRRQDLSDEDEAEDGGSEDDASPSMRRKRKSPKRDVGEYEADDFVVEDTEEEDEEREGGGSSSMLKKKARSTAEEDVENDSLDDLEEKIEQSRKKNREVRAKVPRVQSQNQETPIRRREERSDDTLAKEASEGEDMVMSAESQDEEEEPAVRRPGVGSRKKIVVDDEEE